MPAGHGMYELRMGLPALRPGHSLHRSALRQWLRRLRGPSLHVLCCPGMHFLRGARTGAVRALRKLWHRLSRHVRIPLWTAHLAFPTTELGLLRRRVRRDVVG